MATPLPSQMCHNYHPHCEATINNQINMELYASYMYLSMYSYFNRDDMALKHLAQFFLHKLSEKREFVERLMWLQNQRGGHIHLRDVSRPDLNHWDSCLGAIECALHLEMSVNQSLLDLYQLGTEKKDAHLCDFLEHHYLHEQEKSINELVHHLTNLHTPKSSEAVLAAYLFDKLTLDDSDKN
ncbi:ferritin heavy polypeptide-like 17 [Pteropus medius]|uniref:ferritin heavy polypeptide-like 17 n=1 Tax=Pteropus vampyrus TaxID=132908 RepID=UPI00196A8057|nr:ferritin heavy polypeptide-like 17 [Pteropus giganteus]